MRIFLTMGIGYYLGTHTKPTGNKHEKFGSKQWKYLGINIK
jgi:hypothetical protein